MPGHLARSGNGNQHLAIVPSVVVEDSNIVTVFFVVLNVSRYMFLNLKRSDTVENTRR